MNYLVSNENRLQFLLNFSGGGEGPVSLIIHTFDFWIFYFRINKNNKKTL